MSSHSRRALATPPILIVPGIGNSGPSHWRSRWEALDANCRRVERQDWEHPHANAWIATLVAAVTRASEPPALVAHSLGCLAAAAVARTHGLAGVLLVAPPDPAGPAFPRDAAQGFELIDGQVACPGIVVAGRNDPYGSLAIAVDCSRRWRCELVNIGPRGHINAESGLGDWPEGRALLLQLLGAGREQGRGL